MNKLMLGAAAVALAFAVSPAFAAEDSGVKLNLGGHFKGYANYSNQDEDLLGNGVRHTDILRETEVHFGGETTLDNGLTVGAHIEAEADGGDSFGVDESYVYFAGSWGRVNVGEEDAAAYLLQVAAPSADDNIDGVRQTINTFPFLSVDYANDLARDGDKLTYLSPVFSGFQFGASYTPHVTGTFFEEGLTTDYYADAAGAGPNRPDGPNTGVSEIAARYEGMVGTVGLIAGAGYQATTENVNEWNVGADLDIGAFGVGAVYSNADAEDLDTDLDTFVLGADYTTGPFKLGASYLKTDGDVLAVDTEINRYTAGVIYTYGPGMTFRGSVAYGEVEAAGVDADATTVTMGTQINF